MFRHQGKNRTLRHNFNIAILLSLVAGIVNITGFLSIQELTTNVTGHFAQFINDLAHYEFWGGLVYFAYIFFFLIGSFSGGILTEYFKRKGWRNVLTIPVLIEVALLASIPLLDYANLLSTKDVRAFILLFAMGLQNAYVTRISNAVVRTTHLTGLFTDLGIELSQLIYSKSNPNHTNTVIMIKIRILIISFFFTGGFIGGFLFSKMELGLPTLYVASLLLLLGLFYDYWHFRIIKVRRKYKL
ncbi:YoaK family protein [Marinoscillum pacificum]|uniref:YoaK family protein n=1 Tax=Marinoscillum pacificum TaxID=392723 RepID=UPI002157B48F|nr:YoaK family protein [Marinoscillum pacificum]